MDVAAQIVVMNAGRIEQSGTPRDLYERPRSEWVMGFVGPVNRLDDGLRRPHDVQLVPWDEGDGVEALVQRVVHLGFEVRAWLVLPDGQTLLAQVTRERAEELELAEGEIVAVRLGDARVFA